MMPGYTLLILMNQRVLSKSSKERIMKAISPPGYHHNGFVATHALGHMMCGYTLLVPINQRMLNKLSKEHNISA